MRSAARRAAFVDGCQLLPEPVDERTGIRGIDMAIGVGIGISKHLLRPNRFAERALR